ncbi:MAG: hypothetical protein MJE77_04355 [Proteobacteria bacterium]|nr:hypothetical protein [Pseudomonadota bacterium]
METIQRDRARPDRFAFGLSFLGKAPGRPESRPARPLASQLSVSRTLGESELTFYFAINRRELDEPWLLSGLMKQVAFESANLFSYFE